MTVQMAKQYQNQMAQCMVDLCEISKQVITITVIAIVTIILRSRMVDLCENSKQVSSLLPRKPKAGVP